MTTDLFDWAAAVRDVLGPAAPAPEPERPVLTAYVGRVVPFPRVRNRPFVSKHAANVAGMAPSAGEKYLAHQLTVQRANMLKRGIAPEIVETEVRSLEVAIRAEIWRRTVALGGAA